MYLIKSKAKIAYKSVINQDQRLVINQNVFHLKLKIWLCGCYTSYLYAHRIQNDRPKSPLNYRIVVDTLNVPGDLATARKRWEACIYESIDKNNPNDTLRTHQNRLIKMTRQWTNNVHKRCLHFALFGFSDGKWNTLFGKCWALLLRWT